eukprot:GHVO01050384.1.p1 GENE.GHVO01050384.1~~GHVO01050384.1.p1  ORF type:complete len:328 (+),score=31.03 GHVO01050384.1:34-1017(+)
MALFTNPKQIAIYQDGEETEPPVAVTTSTIRDSEQSKFQVNVNAVNSSDPLRQKKGAEYFRRLLSIPNNPPIQDIINSGVVPRFVQLLKECRQPKLEYDCLWVLTNITSGTSEQTRVVVENGVIPLFVRLVSSKNICLREPAIWALGNIATDNPQFRDQVLLERALEPILILLLRRPKAGFMRIATWTLSNLCSGSPSPCLTWVYPAVPVLTKLLYQEDDEVLAGACWALSYISAGPSKTHTAAIMKAGVCRRLVQLISHKDVLVATPALRAVGNMTIGAAYTDVILAYQAVPSLYNIISSTDDDLRREACCVISNILAGTIDQVQQ